MGKEFLCLALFVLLAGVYHPNLRYSDHEREAYGPRVVGRVVSAVENEVGFFQAEREKVENVCGR